MGYRVFHENKLKTLALCCISTNIFRYDPKKACPIALENTRIFLEKNMHDVDKIIFCFLPDKDHANIAAYANNVKKYFPLFTFKPHSYSHHSLISRHPSLRKLYD